MKHAVVLLICVVILCPGCSDKESEKKEVVEKPVAEKSAMKLEVEKPISATLAEIFIDTKFGREDKWKGKWVIFEGLVSSKNEETLFLFRPMDADFCHIEENPSNPQLYKYEVGRAYDFSARVESLISSENLTMVVFKFEDKGKLIIPPGYTGIIDVDFQEISDDVTNYNYEKWVGKQIRFRGRISFIDREKGELHVGHPEHYFYRSDFRFIISGFDPHGERIRSYKPDRVYTFTVIIKGLNSTYLTLSMKFRLEALIIEE